MQCLLPGSYTHRRYLKEGFETLIKAGGLSVIHPDILTCGGALELKKIADIADENGVAVAVHMAESPVACLAAVHTAAAIDVYKRQKLMYCIYLYYTSSMPHYRQKSII